MTVSVDTAATNWQVTLWPNRSLSRGGLKLFLAILAACFALFLAMTLFAPGYDVALSAQMRVLAVVLAFMSATFALVCLAFRRNNEDGRYFERLAIEGGKLIVEAQHPRRAPKRWEFQPYWTQVRTRTTRHVEHQIVLSQMGTAVAVGAFLTPEERVDLAAEIETAIHRFGR